MTFTKVNDNLYLFQNESYYDVVVGAIVLPSSICIIDTGISENKVKEFREFVEKETNKKCNMVFITHAHGDHLGGIKAFLDCEIFISKPAQEFIEAKYKIPNLEITDYQKITDDDVTLIFKRTGGHTDDSSYIFCPNYKVLFAGDNLFENMFPYGQHSSSNPEIWIDSFEEYLSLDVEYYIPGHQGICSKKIVQGYIDFIKLLKKTMLDLHEKGRTKEEILTETHSMNPFENTVIYERLKRLRENTLKNWYEFWIEKKE